MVAGRDERSQRPVQNYAPHFPVRPEFEGASYLDRYQILCQKLIRERHYSSAALLWTSSAREYGDVSAETSLTSFLASFSSHLKGLHHEFE